MKGLQFLLVPGRKALLALAPLHRPVEAVACFNGVAELGVAHGEEVEVEGVVFALSERFALFQGVTGFDIAPVAVEGDAERVELHRLLGRLLDGKPGEQQGSYSNVAFVAAPAASG